MAFKNIIRDGVLCPALYYNSGIQVIGSRLGEGSGQGLPEHPVFCLAWVTDTFARHSLPTLCLVYPIAQVHQANSVTGTGRYLTRATYHRTITVTGRLLSPLRANTTVTMG
jgi:hypothetical protein